MKLYIKINMKYSETYFSDSPKMGRLVLSRNPERSTVINAESVQ